VRQDSALVALLVECGYSRIRAAKLASVIDQLHFDGMRSDDLAGALLHWRHRRSDTAYREGAANAHDVFRVACEDRDDPGRFTLPLFDSDQLTRVDSGAPSSGVPT
jgi:hypothetical protein